MSLHQRGDGGRILRGARQQQSLDQRPSALRWAGLRKILSLIVHGIPGLPAVALWEHPENEQGTGSPSSRLRFLP